MDEKDIHLHIEKIEKLINSADKFNEMSFRMVLEGLVNKVGEAAEFFLVPHITSDKLDLTTRLNIIRVASYIQSPHFLIPLKKVIDTDENIHLRKEAIISVAKYNDRPALNILNQALNNIKNPLLQETINTEISKIKRNNPVFALLPRFLEGEKNLKEFHVTLEILKRILTPTDAPMLVVYLNCGKRLIEDGAFEILCSTADEKLHEQIFGFFLERFDEFARSCQNQPAKTPGPGTANEKVPAPQDGENQNESPPTGEDESKSEPWYLLVLRLKCYLMRIPALIDEQLENLGTQLFFIRELRIRGLFVSILCRSQQPGAISFLGELYDKEPELREIIIREYSGNEAAVDLLFEKYQTADGDLKGLLVRSLLNCRKGLDYFYLHFPTLEPREKEIIVNHLPYGGNHDLSGFFKMILQSDQLELKTVLLEKIKNYYEFSARDILFDPANEREFSLIEQEYLDTITQLFPITTVKMLMEKIADTGLPLNKARKYFQVLKEVVPQGFAFNFKDRGFITQLFNRVIQINNSELGEIFLSLLKDIKTFDLRTYYNFHESLGLFTAQQERKIGPQEVEELRKARKNLNDIYYEIQRLEEGIKAMDRLFAREEMDFEQLTDFLNRHSMCTALNLYQLTQLLKEHLAAAEATMLKQWIHFFYQLPMAGYLVKDAILEKLHLHLSPLNPALTKLYHALPQEPYKIVIQLVNRSFTAMLKEQCRELIPGIPVSTIGAQWKEGDVLVCDTETLREFILKNTLPSKKLFLVLDNRSDFSSFKSYNPRPLMKPVSAYRVLREILKEFFV